MSYFNVETIASKIHGIATGLEFIDFIFVPLFLSIIFRNCKDKFLGKLGIIFFVINLSMFLIFIMSDDPKFQNTIIGLGGLWERLVLLSMYMPLAFVAIKNIVKEPDYQYKI